MRAISARDFNQDTAGAKRAALAEPVVILDRGEPSHVLMSIIHYRALQQTGATIADLIGVNDDVALPLPSKSRESLRTPDL